VSQCFNCFEDRTGCYECNGQLFLSADLDLCNTECGYKEYATLGHRTCHGKLMLDDAIYYVIVMMSSVQRIGHMHSLQEDRRWHM